MYALLNRFLRQQNGVAATEFALVTPIFLLMFLSVTELGNMLYYSISIEKGMRSGVTYAARNHVPLSEEVITNTISLTRTGALPSADAPNLVRGYGMDEATVVVSTHEFNQGNISVTVIKLNVDVPYVALIPGITNEIIGETPSIKLTHEQAIIGD